jgi:hypothetical protein
MDPGADISLPGVALLVTELRANTSAHTTPMSDNWARLAAGVPGVSLARSARQPHLGVVNGVNSGSRAPG